jgi:hypothetical protein
MKLIVEKVAQHDVKFITEEVDGKRQHFIEGVFIQGERKNKNDRIYPIEVLKKEVARYTDQMILTKRALGELGHPDGPQINLDRVSHLIVSLVQEGNDFIGKAKILDTDNGRIVKSLLDEGVQLGVSTRGLGSLRRASDGFVVQDDFVLASAADIVADPSAPDAFVRGIMESREWVWDNGIIKEASIAQLKTNVEKVVRRKKLDENRFLGAFQSFVSLLEGSIPVSSVEITDKHFVWAHGKRPSGQGSWGFCPSKFWDSDDYLDHVYWAEARQFAAAKEEARKHFAKLGIASVVVCS